MIAVAPAATRQRAAAGIAAAGASLTETPRPSSVPARAAPPRRRCPEETMRRAPSIGRIPSGSTWPLQATSRRTRGDHR